MLKILHSADWHRDAPLRGFTREQARLLRRQMLTLPDRIADIAIREGCDLMLLSGDLFDGEYSRESCEAVYRALDRVEIPVFIAPGNHDCYSEKSPWFREIWPGNVHIFKHQAISSVRLDALDCRVYGGAFTGPECPSLLEGFRAVGKDRWALMVLHGDPSAADSPYCPVTAAQVREAGLDYVALGHIHAAGRFGAGAGMCAWPGCPQGRGYDETGLKGVLIAELDQTANVRFIPLDGPRFYDLETEAGDDPVGAVERLLPAEGTEDFYRIHLTGEVRGNVMDRLRGRFENYPNLKLLDQTVPAGDLWETGGEDSLEGIYFRILRDACQDQDAGTVEALELAARISRQILQGREVELP